MKEQCKQAVAKALGKQSLTAQEATDIEARINETMRNLARKDINNWRNLSDAEKLSEAAKQVAIDIQEQLKRKHKNCCSGHFKTIAKHRSFRPWQIIINGSHRPYGCSAW